MSQLHAELTEQAAELGFDSIEQAEACGYEVIGTDNWVKLVPRDPLEEMSEAHKAWLEEKQQVLNELVDVIHDDSLDWVAIVKRVEHAINFIEKGEA